MEYKFFDLLYNRYGEMKLNKYFGPDKEVIIPDRVIEIGERAFEGRKDIIRVKLPEKLEYIREAAFKGCVKLESINFPSSLKGIGKEAFQKNSKLGLIRLPEGLEYIGENAFKDCGGLAKYGPIKEVVLPSTLKDLYHGAFACQIIKLVFDGSDPWLSDSKVFTRQIDELIIGEHITKVNAKTFSNSYISKKVTFLSHETRVTDTAFSPSSYRALAKDAYPKQFSTKIRKELARFVAEVIESGKAPSQEYTDLWIKAIKNLKSSLEEVAKENKALRTIMVREKLVSKTVAQEMLEDSADNSEKAILVDHIHCLEGNRIGAIDELDLDFDRVPTLTEVRKKFGVRIKDGKGTISSYKSNDPNVVIPQMAGKTPITEIGDDAFSHNCKILSVVIPEGITHIGNNAFDSCRNLKSVIIPESVISVGKRAFVWCTKLTDISVPDSVTCIWDESVWT